MTDAEFGRACSLASRMLGLDMGSKRVLLECRLAHEKARLGCPTFAAYLNVVESGADAEARDAFADLVTTHFTYFLRERSQFDFLTEVALPELALRKPSKTWRILSVGCSTGEECYTLSMTVEDYRMLHPGPRVSITGIDVSPKAVSEARTATYPAKNLEKVPGRWLHRHFKEGPGGWTVTGAVRDRVSFACGNLATNDIPPVIFDLILCRNVIIYFDEAARERAFRSLHERLAPDGYLVMGHAEIVRDRALFCYEGNSIYRKRLKVASS